MKNTLVILISLSLFACEQSAPKVYQKISPDAVILAFGDSLTYGTGASGNTSYPSILSELSQHKVINAGIPGEVSQTGLRRLSKLLDQYQPELMILIHGGNDLLRRVPEQQLASNLSQMITTVRERDIKVVMLGVPKPQLFLLSSAELYQQVAEEQHVPVDLETLPEILSDNGLKSDRIHPNSAGYRLMAENIYNLLVNTGALSSQ